MCYVHVPEEKRTKLDEKAELGIFIGYSSVVKAYRVYNLKTKKVQISRNIRFDEKLIWNWEKHSVEDAEPDFVGGALNDGEEDSEDDEEVVVDEAEPDETCGIPVRGIRTLQDVYQRCNVVVTEPTNSTEALSIDIWKKAML